MRHCENQRGGGSQFTTHVFFRSRDFGEGFVFRHVPCDARRNQSARARLRTLTTHKDGHDRLPSDAAGRGQNREPTDRAAALAGDGEGSRAPTPSAVAISTCAHASAKIFSERDCTVAARAPPLARCPLPPTWRLRLPLPHARLVLPVASCPVLLTRTGKMSRSISATAT